MVVGPGGFGTPHININEILLNGNHRENLDGDDCLLTPYEQTYSCDTANKPYGAVVQDILAQAKKIAPDAIRVRVGKDRGKEAGKRKFGLYGYPSKTATLGLATCSALRGKTGEIAAEMHSRRADQHEKINGFLERHAREANCVYSQMLAQCYPEASRRCASVEQVGNWLGWEK